MKCVLSFFVFTVLIPGVIYGQAVYEPGYIVTLQGDTVRGFVNDAHWSSNPDRFEFKQTMGGPVTLYKVLFVQAFGVSNRTYVSAIADVELSPIETGDLETNSAFRIATDTVFLTPIFQGSKSLYYNRQGRRYYYYIGRGPLGFELLQYKKYYREGTNAVAENNKFVGQLVTYLNDCPDVTKKLSNTNYTQLNLEKVFQKYYYSCKHIALRPIREVQERRSPSDPPAFELGVFVGMSRPSILFTSSNPDFTAYKYNVSKYNVSVKPTAGIYWNVFARKRPRWKLSTELMYSSYDFEGVYNTYFEGEVSNHTEISLACTNIYANIFVRYTAKLGELSWFVNGGGTLGTFIVTKSRFYHTNVMETTNSGVSGLKSLTFGFAAGTGLQYRRFSLECRYQVNDGPFDRSLVSTGSLLLGCRLIGSKE